MHHSGGLQFFCRESRPSPARIQLPGNKVVCDWKNNCLAFHPSCVLSKCDRNIGKRFNHLHIAYRAPDSRLGGSPVPPSGWVQSAAELDKGRRRFWPERMPTQGFIDRETSRHCLGQPEPLLGGIAGNRGDPALLRRQNRPQTLAPAPPVGRTTVSSSWSRPALAGASNLPPISLFSLTGSTFSSTYFARLP